LPAQGDDQKGSNCFLRRHARCGGVFDALAYWHGRSLARHGRPARHSRCPSGRAQIRFCLCHERSAGVRLDETGSEQRVAALPFL
jgi:hypothetical protein